MTEHDPSRRSPPNEEEQEDTPYAEDEAVRTAEEEGKEATESTSQ